MNGIGAIIGSLGSLCCCFLVVGGIGYLAYRLLVKKKAPPGANLLDAAVVEPVVAPVNSRVAQYGNIISGVTDEGFYLLNSMLTQGSMVHYRYRGPTGWVTRAIPYQPGPQGHFVYVGSKPTDLQIVDVVPGNPSIDDRFENSEATMIQPNPFLNQPPRPSGPGPVPPSMVKTIGDYPAAY